VFPLEYAIEDTYAHPDLEFFTYTHC